LRAISDGLNDGGGRAARPASAALNEGGGGRDAGFNDADGDGDDDCGV
jgi:hypothetical protein